MSSVHWAPGGVHRRCGRLLPTSSGPCSERFDRHAWSLNINATRKKARMAEEKNTTWSRNIARILTRLARIYQYISIPNNPSIVNYLLLNQPSAASLTSPPSGNIEFSTAIIHPFSSSVNHDLPREKEYKPYRGRVILRKIQFFVLYYTNSSSMLNYHQF